MGNALNACSTPLDACGYRNTWPTSDTLNREEGQQPVSARNLKPSASSPPTKWGGAGNRKSFNGDDVSSPGLDNSDEFWDETTRYQGPLTEDWDDEATGRRSLPPLVIAASKGVPCQAFSPLALCLDEDLQYLSLCTPSRTCVDGGQRKDAQRTCDSALAENDLLTQRSDFDHSEMSGYTPRKVSWMEEPKSGNKQGGSTMSHNSQDTWAVHEREVTVSAHSKLRRVHACESVCGL